MSLIFSTNQKLFEQSEIQYGSSDYPKNEFNLYINTNSTLLDSPFSLNTWHNPVKVNFDSISQASNILKNIQRNWILYPLESVRRSKLIEENLPKIQKKNIKFGEYPPNSPIGSWTLLNKNTLFYSSACSQKVPYGIYNFEEDISIPSRAYLKLWEFFTRYRFSKNLKNLKAIDLGSCPGGWTWVLSKLFNTVISIDKAPLDEKIVALKNVKIEKKDILKLDLEHVCQDVSWIFCDAALEPSKIIKLLTPILKDTKINFVCTLKLTKNSDFSFLQEALLVQGSTLTHLSANKNEITWLRATE